MWQASQSPVPGYKLEKFVGKGNFGEVWQSTSPGGTKCALKFLNLRERQGRKELRAIQRLKQIRHANLMPINAMWLLDEQQQIIPDDQFTPSHPFMEDTRRQTLVSLPEISEAENPKTLVIAMPLAEGNLLELLHQRQKAGKDIPVEELLVYMLDAARALDYLNAQCHEYAGEIVAVQHGDVKPENLVLLGGSVMLCDFGVARTLGVAADTRGTSLGGSLAYMAPECMAGQINQHSDQFSLAISYAELRLGRLPFADESITQVIEDRRKGQLDLEGMLPAEQRVVRRACSIQPEKRFGSNVELIEALRGAVLATQTQSKRSHWLAPAIAALGLSTAAFLSWLVWQPTEVITPEPPAVKSAAELFAEAISTLASGEGSSASVTEAAEKYNLAIEAGLPLAVPDPRWLGVPDNTTSKIYSSVDLRLISQLVDVHPRGARVIVVGPDGRSLLELGSGAEDTPYDLDLASPIASVHWLDDSHVLVRDSSSTLWRIQLAPLQKEQIASGVLQVATSPLGKVGLAASDGNGTRPPTVLRIRSSDKLETPYPAMAYPLIAIDSQGSRGIRMEEFEKAGTATLSLMGDPAQQPTAFIDSQLVTDIEPNCVTCLQINELCFAVVGGKSQKYPGGLAVIPFPAVGSPNQDAQIEVFYPVSSIDQDLFGEAGRVVRSLATHSSAAQAFGLLATGQDASIESSITELWKVLSDGSAIHQGLVGQETQGPSISCLAFDPSGDWLVRGTSFGEVLLTKLSAPQVDFELMSEDYQAKVRQVQVIDGKLLATFDDASILMWDFRECQMVYLACQSKNKELPQPVLTRAHAG